jgi:hypothetical protein
MLSHRIDSAAVSRSGLGIGFSFDIVRVGSRLCIRVLASVHATSLGMLGRLVVSAGFR